MEIVVLAKFIGTNFMNMLPVLASLYKLQNCAINRKKLSFTVRFFFYYSRLRFESNTTACVITPQTLQIFYLLPLSREGIEGPNETGVRY